MTAYLVELKDTHIGVRFANRVILSAGSTGDAKAYAKALFGGDSGAAWDDATVTAIADVAADAPAMLGYRLRVRVEGMSPAIDVEVTGAGTDDTIDEIAALMVTALNLTVIANASYATNVLTIATGSGGDDLGDKTTIIEWFPPVALAEKVAIPGLLVSQVHEGVATDVLTATFPVDTYAVPTKYRALLGEHEA